MAKITATPEALQACLDQATAGDDHANNAIQYCAQLSAVCDPTKSFFGKKLTKDWARLNVRFVNDLSNHRDFPAGLRAADYPIEDGRQGDPGFEDAAAGRFGLRPGSPCLDQGRRLTIERPDGAPPWTSSPALDIGAVQTDAGLFDELRR